MKNILFRADAKPSLGIGDLVSLIHLSKYFGVDDWQAHFIIRPYQAGIKLTKKHGLENVCILEKSASLDDEISAINTYITNHEIDVSFFEITERKLTEYKNISNRVLKVCVSFDGFIPADMDLVIDWDVEADKFFDPSQYPNTVFLLGPEYVILPMEFNSPEIKNRMYQSQPKQLLVTMGGADEFNCTARVVETLIKNRVDIKVNILVGVAYEYMADLEKRLASSGLDYVIKYNITNMFREYLECDIAISAGGLGSSELVATRTPALLLATYEHQIARCRYFDDLGYARYLGFMDFDEELLLTGLKKPPAVAKDNLFKTFIIKERIDELLERR